MFNVQNTRSTAPLSKPTVGRGAAAEPTGPAARGSFEKDAIKAKAAPIALESTPGDLIEGVEIPQARQRADNAWKVQNPTSADGFYRLDTAYTAVNDAVFGDIALDVNQPGAAAAYRQAHPPDEAALRDAAAKRLELQQLIAYPESPQGTEAAQADFAARWQTLQPTVEAMRNSANPAERARFELLASLETTSRSDPRVMATALEMAQAGNWDGIATMREHLGAIEASTRDESLRAAAQEGLDQLEANRPLEQAALAKLSPADRAKFNKLAKLAGHNPHGRLALGLLLIEGKLTGKPNSSGENLLGALSRVADQPLAGKLDRARLVNQLLRETANPQAIAQQGYNTCTVTSAQILTAMRAPAEYVRIVGGLATPGGKVTLASGSTLQRNKGTAFEDGSGRTDSSRLWQAAMMEYGNEAGRAQNGQGRYSNQADVNSYLGPKEGHQGFNDVRQIDRVLDGVFGHNVDSFMNAPGSNAVERVKAAAAQGQPVPVALQWGGRDAEGKVHGGHQLVLTGIENGEAVLANPWGQINRMPMAEFESRLIWASIDRFELSARGR